MFDVFVISVSFRPALVRFSLLLLWLLLLLLLPSHGLSPLPQDLLQQLFGTLHLTIRTLRFLKRQIENFLKTAKAFRLLKIRRKSVHVASAAKKLFDSTTSSFSIRNGAFCPNIIFAGKFRIFIFTKLLLDLFDFRFSFFLYLVLLVLPRPLLPRLLLPLSSVEEVVCVGDPAEGEALGVGEVVQGGDGLAGLREERRPEIRGLSFVLSKPIRMQYHLEPFGLDNLCRPMVEYRTTFWGCAAAGPPLVAAGPFAVRPYPSEPATEQEGDSLQAAICSETNDGKNSEVLFCLRPCPAHVFSKHAVGPHQTLEILSSCINSFFIDREHIA